MKIPRFWHLGLVLCIVLPSTLLITSCLKIERLDQPTHARAGEIITTTVVASHSGSLGGALSYPYFGIHLPKSWTVVPPLNYSGGYTGSITYDANLLAQMENISPKPNYEWWVGVGDGHDPALANTWTATGTVRIQSDDQAGIYYLGYMTGDSFDGISSDLQENIPITITSSYGAGWKLTSSPTYVVSGTTTALIPLTLIDLGEDANDSFDLSMNLPPGWSGAFYTHVPITHTDLMTLYQSLPLTVQLNIPANTSPGSTFIPITATSTTDPNAIASAFLNVTLLSGQRGYGMSKNKIWVIDPVIGQLIGALDISAYGSAPQSLALSPNGQRLYVSLSNSNNILIFDTTTHLLIKALRVGDQPDKLAFTCDGSRVLISDRYRKDLLSIDMNTLAVQWIEYFPGGVFDMAINCATNLALITNMGSDTVTVIDTNTMTIKKIIPGFHMPAGIVVTPDGKRAYVANNDDATIGEIDLTKMILLGNNDVGNDYASQLAISPDGKSLYIADFDRILIVGSRTTAYINLLEGHGNVEDIEVSPDGRWIFVAHGHGDDFSLNRSVVSVIDENSYQVVKIISFEDTINKLAFYPFSYLRERTYLPIVRKR